jgi:hypothetical protein
VLYQVKKGGLVCGGIATTMGRVVTSVVVVVAMLWPTTIINALVQPDVVSCTIHDTHVCSGDGEVGVTHVRINETVPTELTCTACGGYTMAVDDTTLPGRDGRACTDTPPGGLYCLPSRYECAACGWFAPTGKVVSDYTLVFRKYCSPACVLQTGQDNVVPLDKPVEFNFVTTLTVTGAGAPVVGGGTRDDATLQGPCPALVFSNIQVLGIDALQIQCTEPAPGAPVAAGILIQETTALKLDASNLHFYWYVFGGLVVMGGKFRNTLPPVMGADMGGSVLSAVTIEESVYPSPAAIALANFYGEIDGTALDAFTKLVVQPVQPPQTSTISQTPGQFPYLRINFTAHPLNVVNGTLFTGELGPDYELDYYDPGADSEITIEEESLRTQLYWVGIIIGVLAFVFVFFHQDKLYLYHQLKASQNS